MSALQTPDSQKFVLQKSVLQKPVALVTGASRGIGYATALLLAQAGFHIIALARTQGALEALDNAIRELGAAHKEGATLVPCSLDDYEALDRLGGAIFTRWGHLDAVVGNGAILGPIMPLAHIDPKNFERVMAVNVTANYRLIRALDPLLRASPHGRAVFVSSAAAHGGAPYWGAYATSKAALEVLARTYAAETATTSNVKVMCADPGRLRTNMRAEAMPGEDPLTLETPDGFAQNVVKMCLPEWQETGKLYHYPSKTVRGF